MKRDFKKTILVTGGAGYVGAVLVQQLLEQGHKVIVLDLFLYGEDVFSSIADKSNLILHRADLRDIGAVNNFLSGVSTVIYLACISNDPSFELNPSLGKSINYDCFRPFVEACVKAGVERFIFASSSSVYGVKDEDNVDETLSLEPLTDYSFYKAECEKILIEYKSTQFCPVIIRPATVCGYSPRQRLDVIVNILVCQAYHHGRIKVLGGKQVRPNIHIKDMADLYVKLCSISKEKINGKIYNFGADNFTVMEIAQKVSSHFKNNIEINLIESNDNRSYKINSDLIKKDLGIIPLRSIDDAIVDLIDAFDEKLLPNGLEDSKYYNIKRMQELCLK